MNSNKTYKVTVSASAYEYPYTFTTIYETEVEDCGSEDEANNGRSAYPLRGVVSP